MESLPQRALRATAGLGLFFILAALLMGETPAALGLAAGAAVGLFSLWSFLMLVPRACRPDNPLAGAWIAVLAAVKLPLYALVLGVAVTSPAVSPLAVFAGAALGPVVIVLMVADGALRAARSAWHRPAH